MLLEAVFFSQNATTCPVGRKPFTEILVHATRKGPILQRVRTIHGILIYYKCYYLLLTENFEFVNYYTCTCNVL